MLRTILIAALLLQPTLAAPKKRIQRKRTTGTVGTPQTLVPAYVAGDGQINLQSNQKPVVHVGMAQNAETIIEFPATDHVFAVHSGNPEMVTVACRNKTPEGSCVTTPTDRFLVLRATANLLAPVFLDEGKVRDRKQAMKQIGAQPVTSIGVQMNSGLVLTFLVHPVRSVMQQTHRLVVSYNASDVIANRRALGLAVNLNGTEQGIGDRAATPPPVADISSVISSAKEPSPRSSAPQVQPLAAATPSPKEPSVPPVIGEVERTAKRIDGWTTEPAGVTKMALEQAIRDPKKFKRWTAPVHGLSVATTSREINALTRLVVVAVRNTKVESVQIMPGHPDIFVETVNERGTRLQVEPVKKIHQATTTAGSVLPAGAVVYYALVYETPMLSTKQHLRVAVGQINAIDEPAATSLTSAR